MSGIGRTIEAVKSVGLTELLKRVYSEINDDGILTWASAMAYSWMFALFPMVIFLLSLIAFLPIDADKSVREVTHIISTSLPTEAAKIVTDQVPLILKNQHGGLLTLGALLTLWAASGGLGMTMSALNRCYDITEDEPFYIARPKAMGLTVVVLLLVLLVIILLPIGSLTIAWFKSHGGGGILSEPLEWALYLTRYVISLGALFLAVALIYYFGPRLKSGFRFITPGGTFTVVGWLLLGLAFKYYITNWGTSYATTYGAVGGAVILLLFMYMVSLVLLVGAELNSEIDYIKYGRTGGLGEKPGERAGSAQPAAALAAGNPAAAQRVGAVPAPTGPESTTHVAGPLFSAKAGLPPEASRDKLPECPPPKSVVPLVVAGGIGLLGMAAGYLLKRPPAVFESELTPRRRLPKVYPATYAALKMGLK